MCFQLNLFKVFPLLLCSVLLENAELSAFRFIDCSSCHVKISAEWRSSMHAQSTTSPVFLKESGGSLSSGKSSCSCHAPSYLPPQNLGMIPGMREDSLELGVDCVACHMDSDLVAYSSGEELMVPHWVKKSDTYARGSFCAGCHTWGKTGGLDCQDCHMPDIEGAAGDGPHLERREGATHASHLWSGSRNPQTLARGALLEAHRLGGTLSVKVTNLVGVHSFPANGHHKMKVVLIPSPLGQPAWEDSVKLGPDSTAEYSVKLPGSETADRVELRFYPAPSVWPDSFYVLTKKVVD
ncbi:MAG TPA: multiheme c-type cytochrome [archaeon]|nr:multiheme c-type cytochrome [archaeon]